ncbi:ABC transporter ATP-binding protein [Gracilibacillus marinus]|uniref:ABC transporter ATP-binding protein n=1 Tax=Gracilibacillus marinus TaxID=630535 RepID=A0ABV8VZ02_9BACI
MIKKLANLIGEYKKDSLITPIFMVLEVIMEVIIPLLMAFLIDYGINPGEMNMILIIGSALFFSALISLLFGVLAGHYAAKASSGFGKNVRKQLFYNVQNFSFSNIDKYSTASLITRMTTDVTNVQNAYQMILRAAIRAPIMLLFSLIMAFSINARLSLVFLTIVPVLGLGLYFIIKKAHPLFKRVFKTYDKLNSVVQENLRGIRVIKSFVRDQEETKKFHQVSKSIFKDFSTAEKILAFNAPLMQFAIYTSILLISWFGAQFIVSDTMTTGELVSLISYAAQILMSLMMASMVFVMITISRASAERIVESLDEQTDLHNNDDPILEVASGDITFENVGFSYQHDKNNLVLENINFSIKQGETVGIIGGTGSSKTTLVQLIPRLYDTTVGTVKVGGVDVRNYDLHTLRDQVAVVLQKNVLFSGTIKENLRWGNKDATDEELIRVCKLAQAHDFIMEMPDGYDTHIEQGGSNVSGGQKQRLTIARALLKRPKILIFDDSTSAVDTKTDAYIREAIRTEIPETTKIIIAQRVTSVMDADKIMVIDNGNIQAIGTHDSLLTSNAIYQEVYQSQQVGGIVDAI